jgi:hypothetical protein
MLPEAEQAGLVCAPWLGEAAPCRCTGIKCREKYSIHEVYPSAEATQRRFKRAILRIISHDLLRSFVNFQLIAKKTTPQVVADLP